jgi:hypothetical protein
MARAGTHILEHLDEDAAKSDHDNHAEHRIALHTDYRLEVTL